MCFIGLIFLCSVNGGNSGERQHLGTEREREGKSQHMWKIGPKPEKGTKITTLIFPILLQHFLITVDKQQYAFV